VEFSTSQIFVIVDKFYHLGKKKTPRAGLPQGFPLSQGGVGIFYLGESGK